MKLAFSTLPVQNLGANQLVELCDRHSMAAEVRAANDSTFVHGHGLNICDLGSGICLKGYNETQLTDALSLISRAALAGIPAVRIFLGNFCQNINSPRDPLDRDGIVRALRVLCSTGMNIWIETHNEYSTAATLAPLLDEVGAENLGVLWDILHPIEDGELPVQTWSILGSAIKHLHIKDAKPDENPERHDWFYTPLGQGALPIGDIVNIAEKSGFSGYMSLEWESAWRPELVRFTPGIDELLSLYRKYMEALLK